AATMVRMPWRRGGDGDPVTGVMMGAVGTLALMFASGAYRTGETARACLFAYPYLLLALRRLAPERAFALICFAGVQTLVMQLLARRRSRSTFWVTKVKRSVRASSLTRAWCPGLGFALAIKPRLQSYHSHTNPGSRAKASGVARSWGRNVRHSPADPRNVGTPLSAEIPAPVRVTMRLALATSSRERAIGSAFKTFSGTWGACAGASSLPVSPVLSLQRPVHPKPAHAPIGIDVEPHVSARADVGQLLLEPAEPVGLELGLAQDLGPSQLTRGQRVHDRVGLVAPIGRAAIGVVALEVAGVDLDAANPARPPEPHDRPVVPRPAPAPGLPAVLPSAALARRC